ncbi:SDR family NAD(P)-dependent oxidoreductase [Sphingomonas xanthus]|uniref:SDR family oxidoreductase n=1 Tax=Sphingomonas xanthus TaxID=2594473 RepID=A0A516IQ26_9SPHN|nr:SDR family NAD(P)-dependent oxidoreductase [Sphingomonas xanthus]QDP19023.1 SDR family oxidoreductase [Sphingomonas xanthus]
MTGRLTGKVAIVTGSGSGIGKASVDLFRKEGATVIGADLHGSDFECDAGDEEQVEALVEHTVRDHGGLDIFFANAGISGGFDGIFDQDAADWAEILRVNLIGPFLAVKYAAPAMKARGAGAIVATASVAGLRSGAGGPAYSASKAGVINLVKVASTQLAGANIRVNAICPGLIETGMTEFIYERARSRGQESEIGKLNPLKRGGEPAEIAQTALFLASDEASYINGQAIVIDGGLSASHPFNHQSYGRTTT